MKIGRNGRIYRYLDLKYRMEKYTIPDPNSGCLLWTGFANKRGYGSMTIDKKPMRAHRVAFELAYGPIPEGMIVQHKCDVPSCCNPAHLELGTGLTNAQDKARKGRVRNQHMGKTHCKSGHALVPENIYMGKTAIGRPRRSCKICAVARSRASAIRAQARSAGSTR